MKLSKFKFNLPDELIAKYPADNRDESRLMILHRKDGKIEHKIFKDILDYFEEDDAFVMNNTRVFPARLFGNKEKTGAKIEVFLLRELNRATGAARPTFSPDYGASFLRFFPFSCFGGDDHPIFCFRIAPSVR
jgi:S-adenosylmethionine:tRNA-ribosyltransferase-isomerase (queuine synthetase)